MKRTLLLICTLLCANVLFAQSEFIVGSLRYKINSSDSTTVSVTGSHLDDYDLQSVNIPEIVMTYRVTSIADNAFKNREWLRSVIIPASVTYIGERAFYGCRALTTVKFLAITPPTLGYYAFNSPIQPRTLKVPCGSVDAYNSNLWLEFGASYVQGFLFNVETNVNNSNYGSVAVENNCSSATLTATATANACYEFVSWNDGNTDNPRTINLVSDTVFTALFEEIEFDTELSATICEGTVYNDNGFNVSEAGVYTQNLQTINGCDSIVTLTLNVNPIFNTELTASICEGSVYTENNFNVSEAGVYTQNLQTINGCDSIVTLTLNVNPIYNTELTATICEGQVYTENGFNVSEAGVYTQNLQTINGCDSIVTLTLNVNPIYNTELTATICQGQVYTENNFNVSEAGVYTQNLTSVNGCDSIVTLTVSVNPVFDTTINATINTGETYAEFGFNESESGTYVQNLQTVNGCDSTITLNLTVNSLLYDVAELTEITFYPNPTSGMLTFSKEIEKIEVIDNIGKIVMRFFETEQIDIDALPSGAYYLRMTIGDKTIMRKVIKE